MRWHRAERWPRVKSLGTFPWVLTLSPLLPAEPELLLGGLGERQMPWHPQAALLYDSGVPGLL